MAYGGYGPGVAIHPSGHEGASGACERAARERRQRRQHADRGPCARARDSGRLRRRQDHRSPLPAHAELIYAFGEGRVRQLVVPYEVVPLVLVGEVAAVHEQFGVLADLVGDGRVEVMLRLLVPFHADDAAHVLRHGSHRAVVVGDASLEALALVPEDDIPRLGRVVLERDLVPRQISLSGVARCVGKIELDAGIGQEPRKEREPLAIIELHTLYAVALALNRLADRDAMAAIYTVLVRQVAVGHVAALDEALHIDVEELERNHARGV